MKKSYLFVVAILTLVLMFCMVACNAPKTASEGMSKMEDKGYEVKRIAPDEINEMFGMNIGVITSINCYRESTEDILIVLWFLDEDKAEAMENIMVLMEDYFAEFEMQLGKKMRYNVSGFVFYYGTDQACKDFYK